MTDRVIRVRLDSSGVQRGVRGAERGLFGLEKSSARVSRGLRSVAQAAAAFGLALGVRELIQYVDTFQSLQNRLRVVTDSSEELATVQQRLFEVSQETRTSFEATVGLFSRASIAADELGASQEELIQLVTLSGQALAIQGGAAAESAGALRQLSQSFSSGIVRGEEFNSILEGAFPLAQAAARGLDAAGGSVGRLRTLVIEGKVTSQEFFRAILEGGGQLEEQFAATTATLGQSFTVLTNSLLLFVGGINEATGAGTGAAQGIIGLARSVDTLGKAFTGVLQPEDDVSSGLQIFATAALVAARVVGALADSLTTVLTTAFVSVGEVIGGTIAGLEQFLRGNFSEASTIFDEIGKDFTDTFVNNFTELNEELIGDTSALIESLAEIWSVGARDIVDAASGDLEGGAAGAVSGDLEQLTDAQEKIDDFLATLRQAEDELRITRDEGEGAAEGIRQYREALALAAAENEIFGETSPTPELEALRIAFREMAEESIMNQRLLREEIEAANLSQTFEEQIAALEEEIELLGASNEALAINAEFRALAAGATVQQAEKIRELTETLLDEKAALDDQLPTLSAFFDDVAESAEQTLGGIIADPLSEGLDEVPFKFAQLLQQLAADALAAEVFDILANLGGGGGGAGGFLGFIGGLFGGAQAGGPVRGGEPVLVGERGPEIFVPPGSGNITPNVAINQAAQAPPMVNVINVTDPADIPSGIETPEGEAAIINVIQRNPESIRRLLG
jgi:tape measure domain-containing protein